MADQPVVHSTFAILRSYAKPPSRVFAAFSDPSKKRRWYAESKNHDLEAFEMEFRVGGVERAAYRSGEGSPFPGVA
ncbi:MAG TPA: SRPBCC domain-containing protein, partial [Rhizomicrobium sp.]